MPERARSCELSDVHTGDVWVVIPSFNENGVLRSTVSGVLSAGYSVAVVDDGSAVPAEDSLRGLDVFCLRHAVNLGQGAAIQTGSDYALARGAQIVVHFDADGQHDPSLIERLVGPVVRGEAAIALGSRFLNRQHAQEVPPLKRVLLRAGIVISWMFTGLWLSDTHNGFRALSCTAAERVRLQENGFAHATEILELIRRTGLPYVEVPVAIRYTEYSRRKGQSVLNGFNILIDLMLRRLFH